MRGTWAKTCFLSSLFYRVLLPPPLSGTSVCHSGSISAPPASIVRCSLPSTIPPTKTVSQLNGRSRREVVVEKMESDRNVRLWYIGAFPVGCAEQPRTELPERPEPAENGLSIDEYGPSHFWVGGLLPGQVSKAAAPLPLRAPQWRKGWDASMALVRRGFSCERVRSAATTARAIRRLNVFFTSIAAT